MSGRGLDDNEVVLCDGFNPATVVLFFRFPSYTFRHHNNANCLAFIFYDLFLSMFINILL